MHTTGPRAPVFDLAGLDPRSAAVFAAFMRARRLHHVLMLRVLEAEVTPPGQAICLRMLAAHEGATQRELGDMLHLSAPTVTAMLKRMERSGTIAREPDPTDQRVTRVHLTPAGRDIEHRLSTVLASRIGRLLDTMSEGDRRDLERLLRDLADRMAEAIDELPPAGTASPAAATAPPPAPRATVAAGR
jgi:DNA-binding MarR family transcriptional regulator